MDPRILKLCSAVIALAANSALATDITIMPVGDSITAGFSSQLSFREELNNRLAASGCTFISRGSDGRLRSGEFDDDFRAGFETAGPHAGYSGHRADDFVNGLVRNSDGTVLTPRIDTLLDDDFAENGSYPEVLLLNLGTNDVLSGLDHGFPEDDIVKSTLNEIAQLISTIHGRDPNISCYRV